MTGKEYDNLLHELSERMLVADGAMGTLLYTHGVGRCVEALNLSHPGQIETVHRAYVDAGARVIQTNTFAANRIKLARYGFEDEVDAINRAAVRLARTAAGNQAYVLGTIGGIRDFQVRGLSQAGIERALLEQCESLLDERVDGLLLETYYDLEELVAAVTALRTRTDLPLIAHVTLHEAGVLQGGVTLAEALARLEACGADVVGLNCRLGPYHMIRSLETVPLPRTAYLSAYPNASLPSFGDGQPRFESDPDYFAECALALREQGVRLVGGCCGTTPAHTRAVARALRGLAPVTEKRVDAAAAEAAEAAPLAVRIAVAPGTAADAASGDATGAGHAEPPLHELVRQRVSVIVELDPSKKLNTEAFFTGARVLQRAGIDALTMADNSLATPRISNMAMAAILKQRLGIRPLVHINCRDRNLIGLQAHVMGLHALGVDQILAITGDPTKVGDLPGATSVYDLTSLELIALLKQFNQGIAFSGKRMDEATNFSVAAAFNPHVHSLDKAVRRLERKRAAGADYFITQPVFSEETIEAIYEATKHLDVPIYLGVMPLTSSRNAEYLHHEVPGIVLADDVRRAMAKHGEDRAAAEAEGLAIAKALIDAALTYFNGIYLITPFMRYDLTETLVRHVHRRVAVHERRNHRDRRPGNAAKDVMHG